MVNSIIVQHLKSNKRLVIPGFGAFIKKDDTGEVVFVEFLKKDDGVLVAALQQDYSLDRGEAVEVIEGYIINAKRQIQNAGKFIVDGLGTMHIDANSIYNFEYNPSVASTQTAPRPVIEAITQVIQEKIKVPEPKIQNLQPGTPTYDIHNNQEDSSENAQIDVTGLRYQKPIKPIIPGQNKNKTDTIMLIAIIAAAIAILAMGYGMFFNSAGHELTLDPISPTTEQVDPTTSQDVTTSQPTK